jgi:hypothetical protein
MAIGNSMGIGIPMVQLGLGGGGAPVEERFVISVKTDNSGTSANNQFILPTTGGGYNYNIETSDGQTITGNTGDTTITFPSAGEYQLKISGSFPQCFFNGGGDRLKLLSIDNFGIYALGGTSQFRAFKSCSNLVINAIDIGNFDNVTSFEQTWYNCSSLTSFPLIDTSSGTSFSGAWDRCSGITSFPLIDTSSGSNFFAAFAVCSSLTSFPLLDTSSGTNFNYAWTKSSNLASFPLLDTSSSNGFTGTWDQCSSLTSFPSNAFDTTTTGSYNSAFATTNLTTQSIDNILVSLDTSGRSNGTFAQSGGQAPSATGLAAKDNLVAKGWTITYTA